MLHSGYTQFYSTITYKTNMSPSGDSNNDTGDIFAPKYHALDMGDNNAYNFQNVLEDDLCFGWWIN